MSVAVQLQDLGAAELVLRALRDQHPLVRTLARELGRPAHLRLLRLNGEARHALTNAINHYRQTTHLDMSHRAGGACLCEKCGDAYRLHPLCGPKGCDGERYLHRLCDGTLVKL